jgi:hypothetical protein
LKGVKPIKEESEEFEKTKKDIMVSEVPLS